MQKGWPRQVPWETYARDFPRPGVISFKKQGFPALGEQSAYKKRHFKHPLTPSFQVHATSVCTFIPTNELCKSIINCTVQIFLLVKEWHGKKLTFSLLSLACICSLCSPINNLNICDHSEFNFMPSSSQQVLLQLPALQKVTRAAEATASVHHPWKHSKGVVDVPPGDMA